MVKHSDFLKNHILITGVGNDVDDAKATLIAQLESGRRNKKIGFTSSVIVFETDADFQIFLNDVRTNFGGQVWDAATGGGVN